MEKTAERIRENLASVRERIAKAEIRAGREPASVKLIGVTKYVDSCTAQMLIDAGCLHLGESRPQQLWEKSQSLSTDGVHWHLIGHLQRNKVRRTLEASPTIHSIDSRRLLEQVINDCSEAHVSVDVLLEMNITRDQSKTGLSLDEGRAVLEWFATHSQSKPIRLTGLMGMSSLNASESQIRNEFRELRETRDQWATTFGIALPELSMGMSDDFEIAIEEGATMVRIGSILFAGCDSSAKPSVAPSSQPLTD